MRLIQKSTLLLLLIAITLAGCTDADPSILLSSPIQGEFTSEGATEGELPTCEEQACVWRDEGSDNVNPAQSGFIDLDELQNTGQFPAGQPGSFFVWVSMVNRLVDNANENNLNTNDINIQGIRVTWTDPDGNELYSPGSIGGEGFRPLSAVLKSASSGAAVLQIPLISGTSTQVQGGQAATEPDFLRAVLLREFGMDLSIPRLVYVNIQAFGESLDGQDVESNIIRYPIDICAGCIAQNPAFARTIPGCKTSAPGLYSGATPMCQVSAE